MCCRKTKEEYNASIPQPLAQNYNRSKFKGSKLLGCYTGPGQQQILTLYKTKRQATVRPSHVRSSTNNPEQPAKIDQQSFIRDVE